MDDDITVANFTKVRESNTTTTEEVIKNLEKELDEENTFDPGNNSEDEVIEDYDGEEDPLETEEEAENEEDKDE
jgi:hypothetical protein